MEGDSVKYYEQREVESVLEELAQQDPPAVLIDQGEFPPYKRPEAAAPPPAAEPAPAAAEAPAAEAPAAEAPATEA